MLSNNRIFNILLISLFIFFTKEKEEDKIETCEDKENNEYKLIYDEYFLNQEKLLSNDFPFELNENVIEYIKKNEIISYPRRSFYGAYQGNFLHFMHLVYEKKLPLYFTVDHIIYPYIEITKEIIQQIIEEGLYNVFYNFLKEIIEYGNKNNYDKSLINYFLIGFKFLEKESKTNNDEIILKVIDNILDISNLNNNTNDYYYNLTLLKYERNINKMNFAKINPFFSKSIKTKDLFYCITFFQNFIFNIRNELFTIYSIGDLINKSGQSHIYKELKKFFKYIFNEEENLMNPLEIYEYINNNFPKKSNSEKDINFNLYYKIQDNIIKNNTLSFMSNYSFSNEKEEYEFKHQKKSKISLFSYPYYIDQWINYKLVNIDKKRFFPSFYEFITIIHNGNKMKEIIKNRYHYGEKNRTKVNQKMLKYRDGIDMEKEFHETKDIIDKSIIEEKEKWENSYENSFNYLLNIIGHSKDEYYENNKEFNNEKNKMKKFGYESKIFNTLIGSYIHFKNDILLFEQLTSFNATENGKLILMYILKIILNFIKY